MTNDIQRRINELEGIAKELCSRIHKDSSDLTKETNLTLLRVSSQRLHETLCVLRYLRQLRTEEELKSNDY